MPDETAETLPPMTRPRAARFGTGTVALVRGVASALEFSFGVANGMVMRYNQAQQQNATATPLGKVGGMSHRSNVPMTIPSVAPHKRCSKCGNEYPATTEYFARNGVYLRGDCKTCQCNYNAPAWITPERREQKRRHYQAFRPVYLAQKRRYRQSKPVSLLTYKHRRRARLLSKEHTFTDNDWRHCLDYWGHRCAVCGRPRGLWHTLAMDHWIPVSNPDCPGSIPTNIIPLCQGVDGCNNRKSAKDPIVWLYECYNKREVETILSRVKVYFDSLAPLMCNICDPARPR